MYICKNCKKTFDTPVQYCNVCGGAVENQPTGYNSFSTPVTYGAPATGSKAPSIIGMIFGILNMILSFVLIAPIAETVDNYYASYAFDEMLAYFFVFSIFMLPLAIVGLILSFKSNAGGKGMAIAGRITGFIALAIYLISFAMIMSVA